MPAAMDVGETSGKKPKNTRCENTKKVKYDEESVTSIPQDECEEGHTDGGPISLNEYASIGIELPQLTWHGYCNCPNSLILSNTGETVSITGKWKKGRPYVAGGPLNGSYLFSQIHFHWPSEHLLNERRYDLEMHAVHYKAAYLTEERAMKEDDGTVVLVYLFEVGNEKTNMSKLTCSLPRVRNKGNKTELCDSRLNDFIKPFISNYFIYWGSANIGGSDYSLQWLISCSRLCISQNELCDLKELFNSGEGEPPRKQMADSKPTSAGVFLVGDTVNVTFTEVNRSEVRFSDVEESSEAPEKSRSCCFLAKYTRKNSQNKARESCSPDASLEKIYLRPSLSQSSRESSSYSRNDDKVSRCTNKDCQYLQRPSSVEARTSSGSISTISKERSRQSCPCRSRSKSSDENVVTCTQKNSDTNANNTDRSSSVTSSKDDEGRCEKLKKKLMKCLVRKNETHDCIGNGCENQVCSPDKDTYDSKQKEKEDCKKRKEEQRNKRDSQSKSDSSSDEDVDSNDNVKKKGSEETADSDGKPKEKESAEAVDSKKKQKKGEKKSKKQKKKKKKKKKKGGKKEDSDDSSESDDDTTEGEETPVLEEKIKKGKAVSRAKGKNAKKEAADAAEETAMEMGQHAPIILAQATIGESQYIMKSVGTMTTHPPPPYYTRGTDVIGEGTDFSQQGPSISSSQIWSRDMENQSKQAPQKVDKLISAPDNEEPEDLELLPARRLVAEEGIQVEMAASNPPDKPTSEDEQSLSSVLAILAKDPSLGKVVENLSAEAFPVEQSNATTIQSLTNLLAKIAEDRELVDFLKKVSTGEKLEALDKMSAKSSCDKAKTTENSAKSSSLSNDLDKESRQMSVHTESIPEEKSVNSNKESDLTEKVLTLTDDADGTPKEQTSADTGKSKHSFIINVLSEITKDPTLVAELVKTSKETPLAGVIAQALKDLTEPEESKNEPTTVSTPTKISREPSGSAVSANATTQTLCFIVPSKLSKTFSGSSNIPTKANKERTSREPPEPGVSGNCSKQTSSGGPPTKASKTASGSIESTQSQTGPSLVADEAESPKHLTGSRESATPSAKASIEPVAMDTSSTCVLEKASKNSDVLSQDKGEISLASVLSRISKDPSLAKDLASIFRNNTVTADTDPSICESDFISKSGSSKDPAKDDVSKQGTVPEFAKTPKMTERTSRTSKNSSKGNDGGVKKAPEEEIEVSNKVSSDHAVVSDLAKSVLVNILYAAMKDQSSVPDLGSSLKKQSLVSIEENPSRKISTTKASRQSLPSRRESSISRNTSRTLSNRSAQSIISDQRPIMEFSSSKEQLLIEILEKICTAFPATAEMVKSVTWVDILVTALKEPSSPIADRSLENQSLVTILDRISRESFPTNNMSRREIRDNYSGKLKGSGKLRKGSGKWSGVSNTSSDDDGKSSKEKVQINVAESASTVSPNPDGDTLIDVIVSALKEPVSAQGKKPQRSTDSLREKPLANNEVNISIKQGETSSRNKLRTSSTKSLIGSISPSKLPSIADEKENDTRDQSKKSSATDVLIEVLEKHPSAAEITMSLKNPFMIKLLERLSREPSLTDNTTNKKDEKTTPKPSAIDSEPGKSAMKPKSPTAAGKDPSVFTAISGNIQIPEIPRKDDISDGSSADDSREEKSAISLGKLNQMASIEEASVSNSGQQRREQERNRVNFETEGDPDLVDTERPEAEKLHRQEDLNESIKSRRSTDTKRSGDEEVFESPIAKPKTPDSESQSTSSEKTDPVYLEARFLMKDCAGAQSSDKKAPEDATKKPEEVGTSEKKPMYFISEAIDVDPETGKKVLTGRFVTHNKCKTLELYY